MPEYVHWFKTFTEAKRIDMIQPKESP